MTRVTALASVMEFGLGRVGTGHTHADFPGMGAWLQLLVRMMTVFCVSHCYEHSLDSMCGRPLTIVSLIQTIRTLFNFDCYAYGPSFECCF